MENNEKPIYDFESLKSFLIKKGYTIGTRLPYEPFIPEDVKPEDVINGSMEFRDDGIFVLGKDGKEYQVFLYKKDYRLQQYGKPRFHICKCEVIDDFINSGRFKQHYVRANSEPVPVIDLDDSRKQKEISGLPLCKYCMNKISNIVALNSTHFIEILKTANENKDDQQGVETDIFGYTRDWDIISKDYREKHHYTCEKCGIKIEDDYDKQYIHVHHVNGNKLNNEEENLKCLCLYCHAHVDDHHYKRLTKGANKISYYSFIDRYGNEGFWNIDEKEIEKAHKYLINIYNRNNKNPKSEST